MIPTTTTTCPSVPPKTSIVCGLAGCRSLSPLPGGSLPASPEPPPGRSGGGPSSILTSPLSHLLTSSATQT
eukprot:CAMPEP_0174927914 /NCGR_PEP_ID=MMETSP1355-20121228/22261_1 /TAXON_ID=464990 /ORGANISM="Hemiselmis tepida, Strain CCMP443" /LENGTH=70 /DNA_ID=CAMNT_0016174051 /DNA_START=73 /DNA_END=281 /DNA_ORIENTATION=+